MAALRHLRTMRNPDVTLTDLALAVEAAALARVLGREPSGGSPPTRAFRSLFRSVSVAAAAGGIMHGYFPEDESRGHRLLWPLTLLSAGWSSTAAVRIAAHLRGKPEDSRLVSVGRAQYALYVPLVLLRYRRFSVVLLNSLPATSFLCIALAEYTAVRDRRAGGLGLTAMALTGMGALVHRKRITFHPRLLTPDAAAHVLQGAGLFCLFLTAKLLQEHEPAA